MLTDTASLHDRLEAGARLLLIRGEVCKALREGAGWLELRALLKAEQDARQELQKILDTEGKNEI